MRMALLRWFVAAMLLANLGFAAWSWGALRIIGLAPATERDPGRMARQIRPNALQVLTPQAAADAKVSAVGSPASAPGAAGAAAGGPLACLEIGPLDNNAAVEGAERALATVLPDRNWVREVRPAPAQYVVFVGPILSRESALQRRDELIKLRMSFEAVELPGGDQGGYSLGRHDSEAAALAALDSFRERGLRNASVAQVREAGSPRTWLLMNRLRPAICRCRARTAREPVRRPGRGALRARQRDVRHPGALNSARGDATAQCQHGGAQAEQPPGTHRATATTAAGAATATATTTTAAPVGGAPGLAGRSGPPAAASRSAGLSITTAAIRGAT